MGCAKNRPKQLDTSDAVFDRIEVKCHTPIGIPVRSFLHDDMVAPVVSKNSKSADFNSKSADFQKMRQPILPLAS